MAFTETLNERQAVAAGAQTTINSGSTASVDTGNGINMGTLRRARAFAFVGTIPGGGSVNFSLQASATSGGTFSAITNNTTNPTLTGVAAGLSCLEIRADQMPAGKSWLKAILTETGGQNVVCDLLLLGDESEYKPGNQFTTATLVNNVVTAT